MGTTFAFLGDEIYVRAGKQIPSRKHYGDYPQIEDGVGMVCTFYEDFARLWRRLERKFPRDAHRLNGTVLTGKLFAPILKDLVSRLNERFGARLHVLAVESHYFGSEIVVAGLITGSDILAMREQIKGDFVIMPATVLKSDEAIMLDGMTLEDFERQLGLPVHAVDLDSFEQMLI